MLPGSSHRKFTSGSHCSKRFVFSILLLNIISLYAFFAFYLRQITSLQTFTGFPAWRVTTNPRYVRWLKANNQHVPNRTVAFTKIFHGDEWNLPGLSETRAGPGSTISYTAAARALLGAAIVDLNITSIADIACSEMVWQPLIPGFDGLKLYAGFDIVASAIANASARLRGSHVQLAVRDAVAEALPRAYDLVLARDVLFHLPALDALTALELINESGSRYLATTTIDDPGLRNVFIEPGSWYPINLRMAPFYFSAPLLETLEGRPGDDYYGKKKIGIWRLPVGPRGMDG
jgi:hypothetical protein